SFDGALPLNCLRAAGRNVLPPKLNLVTINSPVDPPTKQVACPSEIVDHRLASLEKCLENLLQTLSQPQQKFSQNSLSSGGLKGDQELKLAPCYSKQE
nr:putative P10 protein [Southern cowpea mosaic virus]